LALISTFTHADYFVRALLNDLAAHRVGYSGKLHRHIDIMRRVQLASSLASSLHALSIVFARISLITNPAALFFARHYFGVYFLAQTCSYSTAILFA